MLTKKSYPHYVAITAEWIAIVILLTLPAVAAADFGAVLPWTFWAVSVTLVVILTLTIPIHFFERKHCNLRSQSVALLLLSIAIYGFVQTLPLPGGISTWLASGSHQAYTTWLAPLSMTPEDAKLAQAVWPRITVDASLSRTAAWTTIVIAVFSSLSSLLLADRNRIQLLLIAIAISGAAHSSLGIYQVLSAPSETVWGIRSSDGGAPFGAYINRSNAAVMLNTGLAGSIGLIAWRLAALTGATLNGSKVPLNELLDVFFDKISVVALSTGTITAIGLLVCGSRSGLVGLVGGMMLAFGIVQSANRARGLIPTIAGLGIIATIAIANFDLSAKSTERIGRTLEQVAETSTITDGRFSHWPDALAAAWHQPLVGWGWGAYRYAYLPFQKTSTPGWYINADNLWLEVFVETGFIGIAITGFLIFIVIKAIMRLDCGADPIDHGLASAGWFLLGALLTSQFFDFGLRLPGNSLLAAALFAVIVARSHVIGKNNLPLLSAAVSDQARFRLPHDLSSTEFTGVSFVIRTSPALLLTAALVLISITSASAFYSRSLEDYALREFRSLISIGPAGADNIIATDELLKKSLASKSQSASLLIASAQVKSLSIRHQAADDIVKNEETLDFDQVFVSLSPTNLRRFANMHAADNEDAFSKATLSLWNSLGAGLPEVYRSAVSRLNDARTTAVKAIIESPFSPEARLAVVSMDFAGGDPKQSAELLEQVAVLRKRSPKVLLHAGDLSAEMDNYALAAACWKRAAHMNPAFEKSVLARSSLHKSISANDVTPDTIAAMSFAIMSEVKKETPDRELLIRGIQLLEKSLPKENGLKGEQLALVAQAQIKLGLPKDAADSLTRATALVPSNIEFRHQHILALIAANDLVSARESARIGRQIAPNDQRFENLIQVIARNIQTDGKL